MKTTSDPTDNHNKPYLCEFSLNPFVDCYCLQVTGRSIPVITRYCMGRYEECPVYRKRTSVIETII
jgi:hypothetical protein